MNEIINAKKDVEEKIYEDLKKALNNFELDDTDFNDVMHDINRKHLNNIRKSKEFIAGI